jgi:hypothetical protein|tara:strand:+ start:591 stop:815 length:225 start_codon:yes stop_codon:yes gene_type:complete
MDDISKPVHYNQGGIEPIDYIVKNKLSYCEGNVVKYITRWRHKNGIQDLKKAKQYIDFIIDKEAKPTVTESKDD